MPRPKPTPKAPLQEGDAKFRACALGDPMKLDAALIAAAQPLISQLSLSGDVEAADIVMALCDRLAERREEARRVRCTKHDRGLRDHLWWKTRHLTRKLRDAKYKAECQSNIHRTGYYGPEYWRRPIRYPP